MLELLVGFALLAFMVLLLLALLVAVIAWPIREYRLYRRQRAATWALENARPGDIFGGERLTARAGQVPPCHNRQLAAPVDRAARMALEPPTRVPAPTFNNNAATGADTPIAARPTRSSPS